MRRILSVSLLTATLLAAYPNGSRIPVGNAGEPGAGTPCSSCHTVSLNPGRGSVQLTLPGGNTFTPGVTQRWSISVTDTNTAWRKGFQMTAPGTFAAVGSTVVAMSGMKPYVMHSAAGSSWSMDWTPPAGVDSVIVYMAGAAANTTRQTDVFTASVTLTKAATTSQKPAVANPGIVNAASFGEGIAPGSWLTIFGTNLAAAGVARAWTAEEIVNGVLPTTLSGTSVRINGKPAAISWVSETQLNVQAPSDASRGNVTVEVTTASGVSDPITAVIRDAVPGLFRFDSGSYRYAAAVHSSDGVLVGPAGFFGAGVAARAAQPGEILLLFGTGFGATDPAVGSGVAYSGAAPLAVGSNLTVRIGGIPAEVKFGGLSGAGLYQFNVVVPALPDGDHLVEASAWGANVPTQQYLAVKQ